MQNKKGTPGASGPTASCARVQGLVKRETGRGWKSEPIPESARPWAQDLPARLKARQPLRQSKTSLSDQGLLNGFHPTNDAAYNIIRDTAKVLNLDLRKMK